MDMSGADAAHASTRGRRRANTASLNPAPPPAAFTATCGTCPHRHPSRTLQEAVADALAHRATHPGHAVGVKTATGLMLAERFLTR